MEATCFAAQDISDLLYIQKIKIIETLPVLFNITPASVPITCGSTTPVTFTINNGGGTTGITNYTWNLGATPNGWLLPNGTAVPATYSTGTVKTLTLTPVCGSLQKNVSATVTANGNNYNTNTSAVSITQPAFSISGSSNLCSGQGSYSVNGLPCNATVVWSITPATGTANLSCYSCTTTSLSYVNSGTITLKASISNACGQIIPVSKSISVGIPNHLPLKLNYYNPQGMLFCRGSAFSFEVLTQNGTSLANNGITNVQWKVAPLPGPVVQITYNAGSYYVPSSSYVNGSAATILFPLSPSTPPSNTMVLINLQNACGWTAGDDGDGQWIQPLNGNIQVSNQPCGSFMFTVSPNPATNSINVIVRDIPAISDVVTSNDSQISSAPRSISVVRIYDNMGNLKKVQQENKTKQATINLTGFKTGVYIVEISDGSYKERQQIIIQK